MVYDVIIIGAGASGLFAGINLDKKIKKLILEKTNKIGTKLLLSGGERANVTNINIDIEQDYFSQNIKFLRSPFSKYNQWDFIEFCSNNGLNLIEEDRGRMILESGNSREILDLFLKKIKKNNCEIKLGSEVLEVKTSPPTPLLQERGVEQLYNIILKNGDKYLAKNIIISTGGKSFFQTGSSGDGYNFAENFGLNIIQTFPGLCGITTKKDLSNLSGISCELEIEIINKKTNKVIYSEKGPLLFTHFGLSGPIVFNSSVAIGKNLGFENLYIKLNFYIETTPKKVIKFFELNEYKNSFDLDIHSLRSFKEAKITIGGVDLNNLDNNLQSKNNKGLFFSGEIVDVNGKTGGYNLQWCWTSSFIVSDNINTNN